MPPVDTVPVAGQSPGVVGVAPPPVLDPDNLRPTIDGPDLAALFEGLNNATRVLTDVPQQLLEALDLRSPLFINRPPWHLVVQESAYRVSRNPLFTDEQRYKSVRMHVAARWSWGRWENLLRLADVYIDGLGLVGTIPDPARVRVYAWPLIAALLISETDTPTESMLTTLRTTWITAIQDVAGWALLGGNPKEVFTLDIGPGLDVGVLADLIAQSEP